MTEFLERVTVLCFGASYGVALALEVWHQLRPRPIFRLLSLIFGVAGLLAHTIFVLVQPLALAAPFGSLVLLGWVLAVFYVYGSIHHNRAAWGLFVLPVLLILTLLAGFSPRGSGSGLWDPIAWQGFSSWGCWRMIHGWLLLAAAVGVCVGFVASVMYLVQAHRLKAKLPPGKGMKLLSLERLEAMNRRALLWAFPLLTAGLLLGLVLSWQSTEALASWGELRIISFVSLWLVFVLLLVLRYAVHLPGRQIAVGTIVAFGLLLLSLLTVHPYVSGGSP